MTFNSGRGKNDILGVYSICFFLGYETCSVCAMKYIYVFCVLSMVKKIEGEREREKEDGAKLCTGTLLEHNSIEIQFA